MVERVCAKWLFNLTTSPLFVFLLKKNISSENLILRDHNRYDCPAIYWIRKQRRLLIACSVIKQASLTVKSGKWSTFSVVPGDKVSHDVPQCTVHLVTWPMFYHLGHPQSRLVTSPVLKDLRFCVKNSH